MPKPAESGLYWVKTRTGDEWVDAEFDGRKWVTVGAIDCQADVTEVGPRILDPDEMKGWQLVPIVEDESGDRDTNLVSQHRQLILNAIELLRAQCPVAPDAEQVATDLEGLLDGKDGHTSDAGLKLEKECGSDKENPFNALCLVNQTTFPDDLERGLVSIGTPEEAAREIRMAYQSSSDRNLMKFYEAYAYATGDADWQKYLSKFLVSKMAQRLNDANSSE